MKKIKRICAWCNKELGEIEVSDDTPDAPTHGICGECIEKELSKEPPLPPLGGEKIR